MAIFVCVFEIDLREREREGECRYFRKRMKIGFESFFHLAAAAVCLCVCVYLIRLIHIYVLLGEVMFVDDDER